MRLYDIASEHQAAFDLLSSMEDLSQQEIEDSMAALDVELEDKVISCAKYLRGMEAEAEAIKQAERNMADRRKSIEAKVDRFKDYIRDNMARCSLSKASDAEIAVSLSKPRDICVVDDEIMVPDRFCKIERKPVKADIQKAIKAGEEVLGAHIEPGRPGLTIK